MEILALLALVVAVYATTYKAGRSLDRVNFDARRIRARERGLRQMAKDHDARTKP